MYFVSQWFAKITSHICHFIEEKNYHTYLKEYQSQDFIITFLSYNILTRSESIFTFVPGETENFVTTAFDFLKQSRQAGQ